MSADMLIFKKLHTKRLEFLKFVNKELVYSVIEERRVVKIALAVSMLLLAIAILIIGNSILSSTILVITFILGMMGFTEYQLRNELTHLSTKMCLSKYLRIIAQITFSSIDPNTRHRILTDVIGKNETQICAKIKNSQKKWGKDLTLSKFPVDQQVILPHAEKYQQALADGQNQNLTHSMPFNAKQLEIMALSSKNYLYENEESPTDKSALSSSLLLSEQTARIIVQRTLNTDRKIGLTMDLSKTTNHININYFDNRYMSPSNRISPFKLPSQSQRTRALIKCINECFVLARVDSICDTKVKEIVTDMVRRTRTGTDRTLFKSPFMSTFSKHDYSSTLPYTGKFSFIEMSVPHVRVLDRYYVTPLDDYIDQNKGSFSVLPSLDMTQDLKRIMVHTNSDKVIVIRIKDMCEQILVNHLALIAVNRMTTMSNLGFRLDNIAYIRKRYNYIATRRTLLPSGKIINSFSSYPKWEIMMNTDLGIIMSKVAEVLIGNLKTRSRGTDIRYYGYYNYAFIFSSNNAVVNADVTNAFKNVVKNFGFKESAASLSVHTIRDNLDFSIDHCTLRMAMMRIKSKGKRYFLRYQATIIPHDLLLAQVLHYANLMLVSELETYTVSFYMLLQLFEYAIMDVEAILTIMMACVRLMITNRKKLVNPETLIWPKVYKQVFLRLPWLMSRQMGANVYDSTVEWVYVSPFDDKRVEAMLDSINKALQSIHSNTVPPEQRVISLKRSGCKVDLDQMLNTFSDITTSLTDYGDFDHMMWCERWWDEIDMYRQMISQQSSVEDCCPHVSDTQFKITTHVKSKMVCSNCWHVQPSYHFGKMVFMKARTSEIHDPWPDDTEELSAEDRSIEQRLFYIELPTLLKSHIRKLKRDWVTSKEDTSAIESPGKGTAETKDGGDY